MNPLTTKARENVERENLVISIVSGLVLAGLIVSFFL